MFDVKLWLFDYLKRTTLFLINWYMFFILFTFVRTEHKNPKIKKRYLLNQILQKIIFHIAKFNTKKKIVGHCALSSGMVLKNDIFVLKFWHMGSIFIFSRMFLTVMMIKLLFNPMLHNIISENIIFDLKKFPKHALKIMKWVFCTRKLLQFAHWKFKQLWNNF